MEINFFFVKHQLRAALLALRAQLVGLAPADARAQSHSEQLEHWLNAYALRQLGHLPGLHELARAHEEFGHKIGQADRLQKASQPESARKLALQAQTDLKRLYLMLDKLEHHLQNENT